MVKSPETMVTFKEDTHQYFNVLGTEYQSVTKVLHSYCAPFDQDYHAERKAQKLGIPKWEVLAEWKRTTEEACDFGTRIHLLMENYIKRGERGETPFNLYESFDNAMRDYVGQRRKILSEVILWNDEARVAGTSDIIVELNDEEFCVGDFKTNKKFTYFSAFGNRMLFPLEHITDSKYSVYALQLSVYAYFYELISGKRCRNVFLLYLEDGAWKFIPANYMKYEVMALLRHYKNQNAGG